VDTAGKPTMAVQDKVIVN